MLFLGQGVGPLEKRVNNEWAAKMFSSAKHVSVRADSSRRLLLEMKVPPAVVSVEPDWALALEGDADAERQAEILLRDLVSDERFVAFSIHRRASTSRKILRRLARQLESAAETARELGLRVVFIPNMTAGRYSDDRETARLVVRDWKPETRSNVAFWDYEGSPLVVKSALRRAEALFCTRYHPMVFALSEGTPAFGLSFDRYYDQKLQGISRFFDVKGNVFRFDDVSANWSELLIRSTDYAPSPLGSDIARTVRAPFEVFIETARTA
ncbi:hypothetical protein GCM10011331_22360 [Flavimobilis marinus]|nr:hypothetical protein GCM10011331_22360 [Flavimobilis marinus]